ncbi:unnamed protein product [Amoebophrya sp. A120]|nr:unnamed protein product [Amoebophrya sp. A120]|eukprot:GSA120T00002365001.1
MPPAASSAPASSSTSSSKAAPSEMPLPPPANQDKVAESKLGQDKINEIFKNSKDHKFHKRPHPSPSPSPNMNNVDDRSTNRWGAPNSSSSFSSAGKGSSTSAKSTFPQFSGNNRVNNFNKNGPNAKHVVASSSPAFHTPRGSNAPSSSYKGAAVPSSKNHDSHSQPKNVWEMNTQQFHSQPSG